VKTDHNRTLYLYNSFQNKYKINWTIHCWRNDIHTYW